MVPNFTLLGGKINVSKGKMSEAIDLCSSSSDDEVARPAPAAAAAVSSDYATTSTPETQRKRPHSPMFSDDDDDGEEAGNIDLDATSAVNLSGGSSGSKENKRRKRKKTKRGVGVSKYGRDDLNGSESDDSDLPPPSGLHSAEKKKAGRTKKHDYDKDEIVILDNSDSDEDDECQKPKAAAARTSDGVNSTPNTTKKSKTNKRNIEYDEDDAGLGGGLADSAPDAGASAFDRKKPTAAESEADVWELSSSSDDDVLVGKRGGGGAFPTGRSDPRKVAYDSSNDDHVDSSSNPRKRSKPGSAASSKDLPAQKKRAYNSDSDSSLSSSDSRKHRSAAMAASRGGLKRGEYDSDSDAATHASMDSFDRLALEAKERSKKDTKKTAKTNSKKTKNNGAKQDRKYEGTRRYLTSADATLDNVRAMLRSDSEGGPPSDDDMLLHFDDNEDDHLQVPTAAAPSSSSAKTPARSGDNSRFSSDNGNGMFSPSARVKVKVPAIPMIPNETLNSIGGKLYPDQRHAFARRLLRHANHVRRRHYEKDAFDPTVRAIMALSLRPHPVRSAEVCKEIQGIGDVLQEVLKDAVAAEGSTPYCPPRGKLSAVAPAAILAMRQWTDTNPDEPLCTMEELIRRANMLLDPRSGAAMTEDTAFYLDKNNMDAGWSQIKKLCSADINSGREKYLKKRARKGRSTSGIVFEITNEGREMAKQIQAMLDAGPAEPGPLRQLAKSEVSEEFKHVTLSVDFREGGGGRFNLHKMCSTLELLGCPFVVRELKTADYVYFVGNKLAPFLVERKSIEDVAHSVTDGRWGRQQRKMRQAQYVLGGPDRKCHIGYLIEGNASNVIVHGGKVGRTSCGQSEEDVEKNIDSLAKLGFFIMRSRNHQTSMAKLAALAKEISWQQENGSLDATMTYADFNSKMLQCDDKEGDPPTDRRHQYPSAPLVDDDNRHFEQRRTPDGRRSDSGEAADVPAAAAAAARAAPATAAVNSELEAELQKLSSADLKQRCKDRDEAVGGKKGDLIARLLKPRKPEILIVRKRNGLHVPTVPSCNAAIMIGLLLNTRSGEGLSKEEAMIRADECGASKVAMDQKNGHYDGWAGVSTLKTGDPPLICMKKKLYCLTTQPQGSSGRDVARALHILAHREGYCRCGRSVQDVSGLL